MNITENLSVKWQHDLETKSTKCTIDSLQGEFEGVAKCSKIDPFVKKEGRKLSLMRALNVSNLDKTTRTLVWKTLRNRNVHI